MIKYTLGLILVLAYLNTQAMPPQQIKQGLNLTQKNWVAFRVLDGRQWIYFSLLETYSCGIKSVRYSINSPDLNKEWSLQPCDHTSPQKITKDIIYLAMPLGTAKFIDVQLVFIDGT